ncbi:hypothetical protein PGB90_001079 [Kerria lacca]
MEGQKLQCLSVANKVKIIEDLEKSTLSKSNFAKSIGIPASTLSTILANKNNILERFKSGDSSRKRKRGAEFEDVEEATVKWFKQCRNKKVTISGPILQKKSRKIRTHGILSK